MFSRAFLFCGTAALLFTCGVARGGGLDGGGFAGGPLTGGGGFTPLQRGFGSPATPWLSGGPDQFDRSDRDALPRHPDRRGHGWRRRPSGYGVGFVYPYVDDGGEEYIEEEPAPQMPPSPPPAPPKPSAGPKTVSAPPAAVAPVSSSSIDGGPVHCGAGRKLSIGGASNGGFGCISP